MWSHGFGCLLSVARRSYWLVSETRGWVKSPSLLLMKPCKLGNTENIFLCKHYHGKLLVFSFSLGFCLVSYRLHTVAQLPPSSHYYSKQSSHYPSTLYRYTSHSPYTCFRHQYPSIYQSHLHTHPFYVSNHHEFANPFCMLTLFRCIQALLRTSTFQTLSQISGFISPYFSYPRSPSDRYGKLIRA